MPWEKLLNSKMISLRRYLRQLTSYQNITHKFSKMSLEMSKESHLRRMSNELSQKNELLQVISTQFNLNSKYNNSGKQYDRPL